LDDNLVITLFRHGLTIANERKAYLGWSDSPLSIKGRQQLFPLRIDMGLVFSSDLKRCTDTAAFLFPEVAVIKKKELREIHFGMWEGKTYQELQDDRDYQNWLEDFYTVSPPGGESFGEFAGRVESGWESIKEKVISLGVKQAAIVTHGGVIRYLLTKYAPAAQPFWEWGIPHGSGWEMTFQADDFRRGNRCILLREERITANPDGLGNSTKQKEQR
jgi:alpha-ribazole phosphatase